MKQSKDPFEAAYEEQEETPPESPLGADELLDSQTAATTAQDPDAAVLQEDDDIGSSGGGVNSTDPVSTATSTTTTPMLMGSAAANATNKAKSREEFDEEEEENVDVELAKFPSTADPDKMAKMQAILSQFTENQMTRYESFRRSALQKANMRRLLVSITGSQKISLPMTIVVCGIAKMFVGELVETARIVMTERKESGPIRPCHIREAYRRLKLEGKVPKRSVPRLFR
ncbi:transcription initiation factor TFIID subunit 11 [Ricinus communis]|uniref:transcription initiation factor TFIID subunit 11 n=1 Tax=Ricinus communis TaxID=3988 RepID=UPI0007724257|nr:transcription initiation factor TFIID subunit 11 [Ricinus communis]XP_015583042.1 transcription initiation factor TFIID subunit 11 [Ricinus communis]XP_015583043.1 transcription initiation factor TFIID subunit 11 [Ricinus communis]|eukprot:XP_015583041.1 transcription initiation factor TFIID subunit 11 [Ricinus communis]